MASASGDDANASKGGNQSLTIRAEDFIRTRDRIVTGLTTLIGAINNLNTAFIQHTNSLLSGGGVGAEDLSTDAINNFLATANSGINLVKPDGSGGLILSSTKPKRKRQRKIRDPNAPKRPLTAFFLYSTSARPIVRRDLPEAQAVDVNAEILRRWNDMGAEEKARWKVEYEKNNDKYKRDLAAYKARVGTTGSLTVDDDNLDSDAEGEVDAEAGAASSSDSSDSDSDSDEEDSPPKPPPTTSKAGKAAAAAAAKGGRKGKKGAAAAAAAAAAASPSPSAQLTSAAKETPVPLPGEGTKRKRGAGAAATTTAAAIKGEEVPKEEPPAKKKRGRKSKTEMETAAVPEVPPAGEKKKKSKRKSGEA